MMAEVFIVFLSDGILLDTNTFSISTFSKKYKHFMAVKFAYFNFSITKR